VQTVVIDQDGERGVITAFDPEEPTVQVERRTNLLVPTDLLTRVGAELLLVADRFRTLARHETVEEQPALVIPIVAESWR
jgi:hypothetical protein